MATKKKSYWYVLVMSNSGPVFVTEIEYANKTAHWDMDKPPLELTQSSAEDLAFGLMCNFHTAYPVKAPIELEQPYRYSLGKFEWKWNKDENEEDKTA